MSDQALQRSVLARTADWRTFRRNQRIMRTKCQEELPEGRNEWIARGSPESLANSDSAGVTHVALGVSCCRWQKCQMLDAFAATKSTTPARRTECDAILKTSLISS